ncbi:hypothetical protein IJG14_08975 [bacterium]|nr:hypothetical protein [bacterium]
MGLSASQARYLQLTARRSDNEYEAQQINQARTALAKKMQDVSLKYTNGMNNRNLMFVSPVNDGSTSVNSVQLSYSTITAPFPAGLGYRLVDSNGTEVRPNDKTANAIREKAQADYAKALQSNVFKFTTKDDDGNDVQVAIDGSNFDKFLGKYDTVLDSTGNIVDSEKFNNKIKNMNAAEFNEYWNSMEFSFLSENTMEEYRDTEGIAAAKEAYDTAMAEADEIENKSCIFDDRCLDPEFLEKQLRSGAWTLQKEDPTQVDEYGNPKTVEVHYGSVDVIEDVPDTSDDAAISTEYETMMSYYQHKDKELELELQRLQTSHNAIQTELDSVKKVIEKNVDNSFKTFG